MFGNGKLKREITELRQRLQDQETAIMESGTNRGLTAAASDSNRHLLRLEHHGKRDQRRGLPTARLDSPDQSYDLAPSAGA